MSLGKRIVELRKLRGLGQEELAHRLAVSRQTLSAWENGRSSPSFKYLETIADILGTPVGDIVDKASDADARTLSPENSIARGKDEKATKPSRRSYFYAKAPILFRSGKAVWLLVVDPLARPGSNGKDWTVIAHYPAPRDVLPALDDRNMLYALRMEGDSMEPDIFDGDIVCFIPESQPLNGSVMVVRYNGRLVVRGILHRKNSERVLMRPRNKSYEDIEIEDGDDFQVCGRVLQILPFPRWPKPLI